MTKQPRDEHAGGTLPPEPRADTASLDLSQYALAVGNRVTELVESALASSPQAMRTDPDSIAEAITDLILDQPADPDRSELAELVAPVWSAEHARRELGISRPAMLDRRKTGSLLALKSSDGDFFYPVSQFEKRAGRVQVKPVLRQFMMVLRDHDPWTIAVLNHTPAPELDDLTPLAWVRAGRDPQVLVNYAKALRAEFAR